MTAPPPRIANRYQIDSRLGSGVSGQSFRCLDLETNGHVVVKLAHDDGISQASVEAEAKALAQLAEGSFPGARAPKFHGSGVHEYRPYLVQELVSSPYAQLTPASRLGMVEIWRLWLELCHLLSRAHHLGFVHGDLGGGKLEHLWWHRQPSEAAPRLVVIDWGNTCSPGDPLRTAPLGFGDDVAAVASTIITLSTASIHESPEAMRQGMRLLRGQWPERAIDCLLGIIDPPEHDKSRVLEKLAISVASLIESEERSVKVASDSEVDLAELVAVQDRIRSADPGDQALPDWDRAIVAARLAEASRWIEQIRHSIKEASAGRTDEALSALDRGVDRFLKAVEDDEFLASLDDTEKDIFRRCCLGLPLPGGALDVGGELEDLRDLLMSAIRCVPPKPVQNGPEAVRRTADWLEGLVKSRSFLKSEARDFLLEHLVPDAGSDPVLHITFAGHNLQDGALVASRLSALAGWPPVGPLEAELRSLDGNSGSMDAGSVFLAPADGWGNIPQGPVRWFAVFDLPDQEVRHRLDRYLQWVRDALAAIQTESRDRSSPASFWDDAEPKLTAFHGVLENSVRSAGSPDIRRSLGFWLRCDPRVAPLVRAFEKNTASRGKQPTSTTTPATRSANGVGGALTEPVQTGVRRGASASPHVHSGDARTNPGQQSPTEGGTSSTSRQHPPSPEALNEARKQIVNTIDKIIIEETILKILILHEQIRSHHKFRYIIQNQTLRYLFSNATKTDEIKSYARKIKEYLDSESGRNK